MIEAGVAVEEEEAEEEHLVVEVDSEIEEEEADSVEAEEEHLEEDVVDLEIVVVVEVRQEVDEEHQGEAEEHLEGVLVEEQEVVQTLLSSLTDTLVSSLPKEESRYLSPRIWYLVKPYMEKSESALKVPFKRQRASPKRQNTESGILSDLSWLQVSWVVWITFTLSLVQRFYIWELRVVQVSVTSPM